jgi:hypothetical protein
VRDRAVILHPKTFAGVRLLSSERHHSDGEPYITVTTEDHPLVFGGNVQFMLDNDFYSMSRSIAHVAGMVDTIWRYGINSFVSHDGEHTIKVTDMDLVVEGRTHQWTFTVTDVEVELTPDAVWGVFDERHCWSVHETFESAARGGSLPFVKVVIHEDRTEGHGVDIHDPGSIPFIVGAPLR